LAGGEDALDDADALEVIRGSAVVGHWLERDYGDDAAEEGTERPFQDTRPIQWWKAESSMRRRASR
jgi:hypothetical protein